MSICRLDPQSQAVDVAAVQVVILGAGLFLTLALATYTTGARFGVGLFSYKEIRTLVPGLKVLLRSHVMDYNYYFTG